MALAKTNADTTAGVEKPEKLFFWEKIVVVVKVSKVFS